MRWGTAGCLMATVATNQFFCLSCRLTDELDLHGRCATCGSDAVTYPLRYRLSLLEADECIRERKAPVVLNVEDGEDFSKKKLTIMRMNFRLLIRTAVMFTVLIASRGSAYGQNDNSQPVVQPASDADGDQYIEQLRKDVRSLKKEAIAANLDLTDDEAVKFWPVYDQYTSELAKIDDAKFALIKEYARSYTNMTDKQAEAYVRGRAAVEDSANQLRLKYFAVFRRGLSGKTAAAFLQIEWWVSLLIDLQLASRMPLIQR